MEERLNHEKDFGKTARDEAIRYRKTAERLALEVAHNEVGGALGQTVLEMLQGTEDDKFRREVGQELFRQAYLRAMRGPGK